VKRRSLLATAVTLLSPTTAHAQVAAPAPNRAHLLAHPLGVVLVVALLGLVPFLFMGLTAFLKISTVLHITRSAIGAHSVPSNAIVFALSAALTLVAMTPVGLDVAKRLENDTRPPNAEVAAWVGRVAESVREPLRGFLKANASEAETQRFLGLVRSRTPAADRDGVTGDSMLVLMPAFMITELLEAFALGFAIFLPFVVIDLVVANVLLALGMHGISASQLALPLKLLLFVTTNGWGLLAQSLVSSYA